MKTAELGGPMKKIAVLANNSSGNGLASTHALSARSELWGRKCDFFSPPSVRELQKLCHHITSVEYEALIVIGGDGTLNQVIRNIPEEPHSVPIYPFPGGTANDLANELGLKADWNQVQTLIDQKKHHLIDLIEVNSFRFATVGGIGVGPIFTERFNRWRSESPLFRNLAQAFHTQIYSILAVNTILSRRDYIHHLHIRGSGFDEKLKTPAVFFCNQANIGGNIKVAPPIDNTDKRFNVLVLTSCSRANLLKSMAQARLGKLPTDSLVFSTDSLSITDLDHRQISTFGDGEPLARDSHLEFKILPKSLRVYSKKNQVH